MSVPVSLFAEQYVDDLIGERGEDINECGQFKGKRSGEEVESTTFLFTAATIASWLELMANSACFSAT